MEALCSSLVVCAKTEMIDSSCKSHITGSKGLLSRNAANHTERSWHPQVRQPLNPSLNYACEMTDFPGNFSKHPNSCHTHLSWAEWAGVRVCVCVCERTTKNVQLCVPFSVCVSVCDWTCELRTYTSESRGKSIGGMRSRQYPCQSHTWLNEQNTLHWGWNLNICCSSTSKSPQGRHVVIGRPSQTRTVSSALCVSHLLSLLHECLLATSPLHCTPSPPLALLF